MNLISLRYHKSRYKFVDIPSEICECDQGVEDSRHVVFNVLVMQLGASLAVSVMAILQRKNLNRLGNHPELYPEAPISHPH